MLFMINKKIYLIICVTLLFVLAAGTVSATDNITQDTYKNVNVDNNQQIVVNNDNKLNNESITSKTDSADVNKKYENSVKTGTSSTNQKELTLNVSVVNKTVDLVSDAGSESAITKNITTVDGVPNVIKLGIDYAYADEDGTYTIEGSEIRRVMRLDSLCQQIYGYVPKYTFFRSVGSNVKYVISREKWNVIARSLNGYHVNQGYAAVNTPYSVTVNLSGKSRYYNVYYDAQEWINGHQYTCGPTAMSMISQALNCYASERRLAGLYGTTASDGTDESSIIRNSPTAHMKLTDITDSKSAVKTALTGGKMVFWHIRGHYMCVVGYNKVTDKFLCLNPSGPSHNINAVQWATWTQMMNTDRGLKDKGFMSVMPCWDLTSSNKTNAKYYYYNMGGKYTVPANSEYCNNGYDNKVKVVANTPSSVPKTTNKTVLRISSDVTGLNTGKIGLYLGSSVLKSGLVKDGVVCVNYTLPAYVTGTVTLTSKYFDSSNTSLAKAKLTFNTDIVGKKYSNTTKVNGFESVLVDNVVAKKDDVVTFTAHVTDDNGKAVDNGKVVFKLNGNTLKRNGTPLKVKVVDGVAKLKFTIPNYSAKTYKLTAVFGNDTTRLEDHATLTIQKLATKISGLKFSQNGETGRLVARIVDENGDIVERDTKISVKVDGKTIIRQVKVSNGLLNKTFDLSRYKNGNHTIQIIAGENGLYKSSRITLTFNFVCPEIVQSPIHLTNISVDNIGDNVFVVAEIVDENESSIVDDFKVSVKIGGNTLVNKAVVSDGFIYEKVDVSDYDEGSYSFVLIVGETKYYESVRYTTTIKIS